MATTSRDLIQQVYRSNIAAGTTDIQVVGTPPAGERWQVSRVIFADEGINDGLSGAFAVDWGTGPAASRQIITATHLTGNTYCEHLSQVLLGDGTNELRVIRKNNGATPKEMVIILEGFKRIGDL